MYLLWLFSFFLVRPHFLPTKQQKSYFFHCLCISTNVIWIIHKITLYLFHMKKLFSKITASNTYGLSSMITYWIRISRLAQPNTNTLHKALSRTLSITICERHLAFRMVRKGNIGRSRWWWCKKKKFKCTFEMSFILFLLTKISIS